LARFDTGHCQHGSGYYPQAFATWIAQLSSGLFIAQHLGATDQSDATVGPQLLPRILRPHDLVLGDANWGGYPVLAVIQRAEAFHLCRAPGALQVLDHVHSQSSAQDLDLVLSPAPKTQARWRALGLELPQQLPTRAVQLELPAGDPLNGRVQAFCLTNLPRASFPQPRLQHLAALRWNQETLHGDVKTRLGLGQIRSTTPEGVRQEVLAHLCVHNLLRHLMRQALPHAPWCASLVAALSALRQANQQLRAQPQAREQILALLRDLIAVQPLAPRPGRSEPRQVRPNRKPYPVFKTPRADWRRQRKEAQQPAPTLN
jgi:hypothetical protein